MNAPSKTEVEAPYVLREDKDGVATLTLNRGDRMNPLSTAMLSALQAELDRLARDTAARDWSPTRILRAPIARFTRISRKTKRA